MADYVLSAELSLQDRFTSKLKTATYQSNKFKSTINNLESKLKKLEKVKSFEKVAIKASSLINVIKKLNNNTSFNKMKEKIESVGSSIKKLGNNFNNFGNRIGKISSKISNFGGKIKNAIKYGVVGASGALVGGLKIGGDFEALSARMLTAFQGNKEKAAEYYKWANKFANETPFGNDEIIDATVRLKSYGYDPKRMMTMLGDFAGAYGKTLEQSIEAYADASRGEFERLKEFGIQKDEVLKYAKETMGKEVKMSGTQIKDMDTFMKALEGVIKSRSKDGMKNLAKTLKGMLSTTTGLLKYNVAKLMGVTDKGEIRAGSLIDRFKQKLEKFNNYLQSEEGKKALNSWIEKFEKVIPKIIELGTTIKNKLNEIFGDDFISKLNNSIKKFKVDNLVKEFDRVKEKLESIYETIKNIGATALGAKIGAFFGGVPGAVIGGVVGGTVSAIGNNLDDNTEIIDNPNISIKERMKAISNKKGMYDDPFNPYYKKIDNITTTNFQEKIENDYSKTITNNSNTITDNFTSNLNKISKEVNNQYLDEKTNNENEYLNNYFNNNSVVNEENNNSNYKNYSFNNNSKETPNGYESSVINSSYYQKPKLDFNITFDFKNSHITMDNFEENLKSMSEKYFENVADKYFQDITLGFETSF